MWIVIEIYAWACVIIWRRYYVEYADEEIHGLFVCFYFVHLRPLLYPLCVEFLELNHK